MPARYKPPVRCTCIECIATKDVDGTPGRYFPANEYRTHQRRITQAAQQDVDQITARLLAATLTDEGVQADDSPLWKSRSEFQENIRISPPALAEPTMLDVQEALQNLTLSSDLSTLRQSPSPTRHISHRGLTRFQSATNTARRNKDKKKYSTAIVRASKILQNVEQRAQLCEERLTSLGSETNSHTILQELEKEIDLLFTATNKISCHDETVKQKKHDTVMMITRIDGLITEVRNLVPVPLADSDPIRFTTDHHYEVPVDSLDVVAQCAIFLGAICSVIMGVSRRGGDFIMSVVAFVIGLMLRRTGKGDSNALDTSLLSQIPTSISAVLKKFNLEGKVKVYATCPACHFNYEPTFNKGSSIPIYPSHCSNILKKKFRLVPNGQPGPGICGAAILQANPDSSGVQKPIKSFVYHLFNDYLAGLTSRHDIESMMDRSCDDVMTSQDEPPPLVEGPFDADFMKTFKGPDGRLFVDRQGEGRYAFSLNIDFFNAEGMRVRGATASYGIISMACLNLPIEIRYKPENMYLAGIVPGPTEPLDQELNHYLRPLVSDLAVSWERGVHLTRTATYPDGRLTRSAVVAAVCDLPAARKLAQLASHSSHWFCSVCQCRHLPNRNRTDVEHTDWNPPDNDQRRKYAESSRDATTWEEQEQIFKETGVRWSEMWNLPYWNPSRQLVVDSMHCLLEGLISHHARYVLGLTKMASLAKEVPVPAFHWPFRVASTENNPHNLTDKEIKQVHQIHALLTSPDNHSKVITENVDDSEKEARQTAVHISEQLQKKNMSALRFVCEDLDCTPNHVLGENGGSCIPAHIPVSIAGTCMGGKLQKVHWVRALMEWRTNHLMDVDSSRHPTSSIKYGTPAVMKQIKTVIRETVTPSWVNSVPYNFGDAAAGTLKADEWRSMATIYLPIALVLSWGQGSSHSSSDIGRKLRDVLDHTMTLFSATRLACMRTMTASRALRYRENMIAYLNGLGKLHPHIPYRTNHHMALHIYDFIKLFGPVHSWWCFPFERLIGILQRQPSNHRYGQLESTMLHTFIKAGKLRRWLAKSDCPPVIKELKKLFDKSYTSKIDDDASTQRWDDGDSIFVEPPQVSEDRKQHTSLPADLSPLIKNRKVHLQARAHFDGRTYSRSSTHLGNSLIQFYPGGDRSKDLIPGSIKYIFTHNDTITYAIQRQLAAPEGTVDPFEAYPQFPARIYSSKLSQTLELVRPAEVLSHYARFDTTEETSVVLSLSRF